MSDIYIWRALGVGIGFVVCIVAHHVAHGRVAIALGDRTPRLHGRVSLSIKAQADPLGTYILPAVWIAATLFGGFFPYVAWGKARSASQFQMRRGRRDAITVALAGPIATLAIGGAAAIATRGMEFGALRQTVGGIAVVGIFMTVWEILPMPGRDGGLVLAEFLGPSGKLKMLDLAQYEVLFVVGVFLILQVIIFGIANPICGAFGGVPLQVSECGALLQ